VCGEKRRTSKLAYHSSDIRHKLKTGEVVKETEICYWCLEKYAEEHYPGSALHEDMKRRLGEES